MPNENNIQDEFLCEFTKELNSRSESKESLSTHGVKVSKIELNSEIAVYGKDIFGLYENVMKNANESIVFKNYAIEDGSDGWAQIKDSLETLNTNMNANQKIQVYFLVNKPTLGSIVKPFKSKHVKEWIDENKIRRSGLEFHFFPCESFDFNSKHSKLLLVDSNRLILGSADPKKSADWGKSGTSNKKGQLEIATKITGDFSDTLIPHLNSINPDFEKAFQKNQTHNIVSVDSSSHIEAVFLGKESKSMLDMKSSKIAPAKLAMLYLLSRPNEVKTIMTPNINDQDLLEAIARSVEQKNQVTLYLPKYRNHDDEELPTMGGNNLRSISTLEKRLGGKIPDNLKIYYTKDGEGNIGTNQQLSGQNIHLKYMRSGDYVLMGSSNMDKQSTFNSEEYDVLFKSATHANRYTDRLLNEIKNKSFTHNDSLENLKADLLNMYDEGRKANKVCKVALIFPCRVNRATNKDELLKVIKSKILSSDFVSDVSHHEFQNKALRCYESYNVPVDNSAKTNSVIDSKSNPEDIGNNVIDEAKKNEFINKYISRDKNKKRLQKYCSEKDCMVADNEMNMNNESFITSVHAKSIQNPKSKVLYKLSRLISAKSYDEFKNACAINTGHFNWKTTTKKDFDALFQNKTALKQKETSANQVL